MGVTSIAVVDDHSVVLEGTKSFLLQNGAESVECFTDGHELLERMAHKRFDIYIVDVELRNCDGSEQADRQYATNLIDSIRSLHPGAKVVINTMHEEMWVVERLTEMHVDAVVYKSATMEQLLEAIVAVASGLQYYSPKFRSSQARLELQSDIPTQRELEVLKEVARGHSTKAIAAMLYISENTVENHRKSLFRKLKARNMAEMIVRAIAQGYLNPEELVEKD